MKNIRVLVVDDSAFSRRTITGMLQGFDGVDVAGYAANGEEGIQKVIALKPDLVTLDLEMPRMDGFTLLRILATRFSIPVIVISVLSGAENVFKALELGALDFIVKPSSTSAKDLLSIRDDLRKKVTQAVELRLSGSRRSQSITRESSWEKERCSQPAPLAGDTLRNPLEIVAIGASTGGPPALQNIFSAFERRFPFAVVVSQHMPAGFTKAFAERLNRLSAFEIKEAEDGDAVLPGRVLIAPGAMNLVLENHGGRVIVRVVAPTATDRYLPSVDVMFESCARIYRNRMLAVILTGMGNDGSKGVRAVKEQGGYIISESEETAVVYGMPREAVATGFVDHVAPLHEIARDILIKGDFM